VAESDERRSRQPKLSRRVVPYAAGIAGVTAVVGGVGAVLRQTRALSTSQLVAVLGFGVVAGVVLGVFVLLYANLVTPERFIGLLRHMGPNAKIRTMVWTVETGDRPPHDPSGGSDLHPREVGPSDSAKGDDGFSKPA
jgi:hypothetical protein